MKKQTKRPPTRSKLPVLRQLCHLIPPHLVSQLARDLGAEKLARTFSHWSHVVALLYAQLVHAISLNDVCDSLRLHSGPLSALRGATPPSKNGLSHANKERDPSLAEALFWQMLAHLRSLCPALGGRAGRRWAGRFTRTIHIVDSTTIESSLRAWTGPSIAGARRRPSVICAWTCKVFCRALSCWTRPGTLAS
jgi:hypothetical protein